MWRRPVSLQISKSPDFWRIILAWNFCPSTDRQFLLQKTWAMALGSYSTPVSRKHGRIAKIKMAGLSPVSGSINQNAAKPEWGWVFAKGTYVQLEQFPPRMTPLRPNSFLRKDQPKRDGAITKQWYSKCLHTCPAPGKSWCCGGTWLCSQICADIWYLEPCSS